MISCEKPEQLPALPASTGWAPSFDSEIKRLKALCKSEYNQGFLAHAEAVKHIEYPNGDALCELVYALESGDPERITKAKNEAKKQADKHSRLLKYV